MNNGCVAGIDDLLRKSYNELGNHSIDRSLHYADIITLANSFPTHFKDVTLSSPCVIVLETIAYYLQSNGVVLNKNKLYYFLLQLTSF